MAQHIEQLDAGPTPGAVGMDLGADAGAGGVDLVPVGAHEAAAAHGAESVGMPQLDFATFPNQIFWLIVTLVVIYLVLSRVALPRIASVLAERQGTITNDIAGAEELKLRAREAEAAYDKALADARSEAGRIVDAAKVEMKAELAEATAEADARIEGQLAESEGRIAEIRDGAVDAIREVARDTAAAVLTAVGGHPDEGAIDRAVAHRMEGKAA